MTIKFKDYYSESINKQIDTPEFKRWFGNSEMKDKNGNPIIFYHATYKDFKKFQIFNKPGVNKEATDQPIFFSYKPNHAEAFISHHAIGANTKPVYLKVNKLCDDLSEKELDDFENYLVKKGYDVDAAYEFRKAVEIKNYDAREEMNFITWLKNNNYDGFIVNEYGLRNVAVFSPSQIKSAIGNNGKFDPNSDNINEDKQNKIIAIFPGRFEPPSAAHKKVYDYLGKKFGYYNLFIATSDLHDDLEHPFSFDDKLEIFTKMFNIPSKHIVECKRPYVATEITDNLSSGNTSVVYCIGYKDRDRFKDSKYYQEYKEGTSLKGYKDQAYYYIVPKEESEIDYLGEPISSSRVRAMFRNGSEKEKKELFYFLYSTFDQKIFNLLNDKINS